MSYHKKKLKQYLAVYPVEDIRGSVLVLVLVLADFMILLPSFSLPADLLYPYLIGPPILFLNLWAILFVVLPRKFQLQYVLFRGVFGVICSLSLMILTQKFAYGLFGLKGPFYFLFSFGTYFTGLYLYYRNHIKDLQAPPKKAKWSKGTAAYLPMSVGLGQLVANLSLGFATDQMVAVVMMSVYSMLAFVLFHFIMELHRYYHLRRHFKQSSAEDG